MSIFTNLLHRREVGIQSPNPVPSTTDPSAPENQAPKGADWQANVIMPRDKRSLLVPAWYRGVTLLMQTMGQMLTQYQRLNGEGGNYVEDMRGVGRSINYLLQVRPNPMMTAVQMQEQIVYRTIYFGNAYVYIERDVWGDPVNLWLCTHGCYVPPSNTYDLVFNRDGMPSVKINVPSSGVLHFKNVIMDDMMYRGLPVIDFAMKALSIAATADDQTLQDVAKGGKYKVLVQEEKSPTLGTRGRANQAELRKMTQRFSSEWLSNDVVMLDNVADAKIISQTASELKLLEDRGFEVNDLARILGIPRIMMMEDQGASYKMPEHATQEFLLRTIQPRIREWEDELNSKLILRTDWGRRRIHVCELALRRLDAKGQAEIDKLLLECGVKSPNELRNQYDLPSVEKGDIHYVSTNLAVIGSDKLMTNGGGRPAEGGESATETGMESSESKPET